MPMHLYNSFKFLVYLVIIKMCNSKIPLKKLNSMFISVKICQTEGEAINEIKEFYVGNYFSLCLLSFKLCVCEK